MKTSIHEHFTDTIFYQIELTAKYCKLLGQQSFEKFNLGISLDEYAILDVLTINESLCQRDIAKLILKDRANTGKVLDACHVWIYGIPTPSFALYGERSKPI